MQVFSPTWTPPGGVLGRLVAEARERVAAVRSTRREPLDLDRVAAAAPRVPSLASALRGETVAIIAEVKRRSPSRGTINDGISAAERARAYAAGGAAAVSVLTEPAHFGGSLADLESARAAGLPLLRKDFNVDPLQLVEAREAGASGALLIARALAPDHLRAMADAARALGLELLVEVRSEGELERALALDTPLIGVNSRDLETLEIDPGVTERLLPRIPTDRLAIAESGVSDAADVVRAGALGADAVLVGSSLSASGDPARAVRALGGVPRSARGH